MPRRRAPDAVIVLSHKQIGMKSSICDAASAPNSPGMIYTHLKISGR